MLEHLELMQVVNWLGLCGIAVFAISGALDAARQEMDILGFILIGMVTGLGGGTLRDLLLGISPVFWVREPIYVTICIVVVCITYFIAPHIGSRRRALLWMDAIGLILFSVTGAKIALALDVSPLVSICMGVITATFGGIIRDVLCDESLVLRGRELYVTASLVGASSYLLFYSVGLPDTVAMLAAFIIGFSLRAAAIRFGLSLPGYHARDK